MGVGGWEYWLIVLLFRNSPRGYSARHGPESGFVERRPQVFIRSLLFYFLVFAEGGTENVTRCCLFFHCRLQKCFA